MLTESEARLRVAAEHGATKKNANPSIVELADLAPQLRMVMVPLLTRILVARALLEMGMPGGSTQ